MVTLLEIEVSASGLKLCAVHRSVVRPEQLADGKYGALICGHGCRAADGICCAGQRWRDYHSGECPSLAANGGWER